MDVAISDESPDRVAALLGRRMRKLRDERGLSQEKVAQLAEVSRETVRRIEAGLETTTAMLDRLLWVMGSDAEELLATRVKRNGRKRPRFGVLDGSGEGSQTRQAPLVARVR